MQRDESERLLENLREAARCADLLGYTESVKTLRQAIGMVLYPMGIPQGEYVAFMARETPQGSLHEDIPQHDKQAPFEAALRHAHSLAEGMSLAGVVTLIDDAKSTQYLYQRFDRSAAAQVATRKGTGASPARTAPLMLVNP